jgi:hypothetical protein
VSIKALSSGRVLPEALAHRGRSRQRDLREDLCLPIRGQIEDVSHLILGKVMGISICSILEQKPLHSGL